MVLPQTFYTWNMCPVMAYIFTIHAYFTYIYIYILSLIFSTWKYGIGKCICICIYIWSMIEMHIDEHYGGSSELRANWGSDDTYWGIHRYDAIWNSYIIFVRAWVYTSRLIGKCLCAYLIHQHNLVKTLCGRNNCIVLIWWTFSEKCVIQSCR